MLGPEEYLEIKNRRQWRDWLKDNHAKAKQIFLAIFKKKYSQFGLSLEEATEEALCFGWIDSTLKPLDQKRYLLRYSPRTSNSIWSISNIHRVEKLIAEGKMTDAGQLKISEAKANGQWQAAIRRELVDLLPKELEESLKEVKGSLSAFRELPDSMKKRYIYWVDSAKKDETRQRRIQKIIKEIFNR